MTHLTDEQLNTFKQTLLDEKARLEGELSNVGIKNPQRAGDWSAVTDESTDVSTADKNELADKFEDLEENEAIVGTLETQLKDVSDALARIEAGTYGHDEKTGEPIPVERLTANPAARTNI
jgi:RNA polymerase-binding transcription factor DksA